MRRLLIAAGLLLGLGLGLVAVAEPAGPAGDAASPASGAAEGEALYDRFCLACHGAAGDGRGPASPWLWPKPRDFTRGDYKWRSTPTGRPPTDEDLARAIRHGVPGTSMHPFGATLTAAQVKLLVDRVVRFAPERFRRAREVVERPAAPADPARLAARGREVWAALGCDRCHGPGGAGDGPAASELTDGHGRPAPPWDLTRAPLRRPGAAGEDGLAAIYAGLVTGLSGTPMPSYEGAAPPEDLWAVAAFVDSIRHRGPRFPRPSSSTRVDPLVVADPGAARYAASTMWPSVIPLQGEPPASLAPAQASLHAEQCARCHARQEREWRGSFHAGASSPGVLAQLLEMEARGQWRAIESCQRCHAPLAEQLPQIRPAHAGRASASRAYRPNPAYDPALRDQGVNCASCHVRGWRRFGPPLAADHRLLDLPGYPLTELPDYQRSDFCLGCHQLPAQTAVEGKPRLNTYREWLEGPYMRRGVQCQHCHMPSREHTFKGVHDPETFRQGIGVEAIAGRSPGGTVSVRARVTNAGAGHYLPTTPTPAAWVQVELVDARGKAIAGARAEKRIGWHLVFERGAWREIEDTRIRPGETLELAAAWKQGRVARARAARVSVRVHPDDFYEGFYEQRLRAELEPRVRALYEEALARASSSYYVAYERLIPIAPPPSSP